MDLFWGSERGSCDFFEAVLTVFRGALPTIAVLSAGIQMYEEEVHQSMVKEEAVPFWAKEQAHRMRKCIALVRTTVCIRHQFAGGRLKTS